MSYARIWVHLVFATKERAPYLNKLIRDDVFKHIIENGKKKNIYLRNVNGYDDHVHCLLQLAKDQTISQVAQLIKGESSFWINKNKLTKEKFAWQDDYYAVSVCESQLLKVADYINNQESHHANRTFKEELDELIREHGLNIIST